MSKVRLKCPKRQTFVLLSSQLSRLSLKQTFSYIVRFHVCRLCCGRTIKTVKSDVEDCLPSNLMCLTWDEEDESSSLSAPASASMASIVASKTWAVSALLPEDFLSFEQSQKKGGSQLFFRDLTRPWIKANISLLAPLWAQL